MIALSVPWRQSLGELGTPAHPEFWFVMSLSLTLGFAVTYPLNWWLVSAGLKHGMMTVAPKAKAVKAAEAPTAAMSGGHGRWPCPWEHRRARRWTCPWDEDDEPAPAHASPAGARTKAAMIAVSLVLLAAGVTIAGTLDP